MGAAHTPVAVSYPSACSSSCLVIGERFVSSGHRSVLNVRSSSACRPSGYSLASAITSSSITCLFSGFCVGDEGVVHGAAYVALEAP